MLKYLIIAFVAVAVSGCAASGQNAPIAPNSNNGGHGQMSNQGGGAPGVHGGAMR
jgi:hypothetical protein